MTKHLGSTISLTLGVLSFLGSFASPNNSSGLVAGPVIILGALAYRSAKKRKLGEVSNTTVRKIFEILALVLIATAILLQNELINRIHDDPVPNLIIPLWALIAYITAIFRPANSSGTSAIAPRNSLFAYKGWNRLVIVVTCVYWIVAFSLICFVGATPIAMSFPLVRFYLIPPLVFASLVYSAIWIHQGFCEPKNHHSSATIEETPLMDGIAISD